MADLNDLPLNDRVKKLEEQVEQLMDLLQIVPRMDTKQADFSSGPDQAKNIFLTRLSEIMEDPSVSPSQPFGR